jgi:hypothetical protein
MHATLDSLQAMDAVRSIILINCGAVLDLSQKWFADETAHEAGRDVRAYVFDSHLPVHHGNINSAKNIQVFTDEEIAKIDNCPTLEDLQ